MSNPASRKSIGKGPKYQSPSERNKTPTRKFPVEKATSVLKALGSGAKTVLSQHPTMLALGLMAGCTVAKLGIIALGPEMAKRAGTQEAHAHLGDLYGKSYGAIQMLAAVQIVSGVAGAVGGVAGALTGKKE